MTRLLTLFAAILFATQSAYASDSVLWKNMDPWSVRVDRTLDYGCFLAIVGTKGTAIRLGFNKSAGASYIMVGHMSWQSIERGKHYPMIIQFDSEPRWNGTGIGMRMGTLPVIYMRYTDADLAGQFAERHWMSIWHGQKLITQFSLKGSYAALVEMILCQKNIDSNRSNTPSQPSQSPDPFGSPRNQQSISDPFK